MWPQKRENPRKVMVLQGRIELPTSPLPREFEDYEEFCGLRKQINDLHAGPANARAMCARYIVPHHA